MTYVVEHVVFVLAMLWLFHCSGLIVIRMVRLAPETGRRTGLLPIAIGVVAWTQLLFVLAVLGFYRPTTLRVLSMCVAGLGTMTWFATAGRPRWDPVRTCRSIGFALPLVLVSLAVLLGALDPMPGWDDQTYHLTIPAIYLAHGGFVRIPFNVYSNWPLGLELIYGLGLALQDHVGARLLHFDFLILLLVALFRFCVRRHSAWVGLAAASILLANPVVIAEAGVAYVELAIAFFLMMALSLLTEYLEDHRAQSLGLAGLCFGCISTLKVSGVLFLVCGWTMIVVDGLRSHGRITPTRTIVRAAALLSLPSLVMMVPWISKAYFYTGNPVYPFLWSVFGGSEWSGLLTDQFTAWQSSIGMGRNWVDYLLLIPRLALLSGPGYGRFDGGLSWIWIFAVPLIAVVPNREARALALPAAAYFVVWALSSQQARFLVPIIAPLAGSLAIAVSAVSKQNNALGKPALFALLALLLASTYPALQRAVSVTDSALRKPPDLTSWVPDPAYTFARLSLPENARLLLDTNHGLFFQRPYVADSFFEASQVSEFMAGARSLDEIEVRIRTLNVTHIVRGPIERARLPALLREFAGDPLRCTPLYGGAAALSICAVTPCHSCDARSGDGAPSTR